MSPTVAVLTTAPPAAAERGRRGGRWLGRGRRRGCRGGGAAARCETGDDEDGRGHQGSWAHFRDLVSYRCGPVWAVVFGPCYARSRRPVLRRPGARTSRARASRGSVFQRLGLPSPSSISKWAAPAWTFWSGHRPSGSRLALDDLDRLGDALVGRRRRRRAGSRARAGRRSATRSGTRTGASSDRSPRRSTSGGTAGARACTPRRAGGPPRPRSSRRSLARARAGPRGR